MKTRARVTQEFLREHFEYRDGELVLVKFYAPNARVKLGEAIGSWNGRYFQAKVMWRMYYLHRLIWLYHFGEWPKLLDHSDRNPRNNRIENLRLADKRLNAVNAESKRARAGFKGVIPGRWGKGFIARIVLHGKLTHLGTFKTAEDAARAYDVAAKKHFGEFACLNFT